MFPKSGFFAKNAEMSIEIVSHFIQAKASDVP